MAKRKKPLFHATIEVSLKPGIRDVEGGAILEIVKKSQAVTALKQTRVYRITVEAQTAAEAKKIAETIGEDLLVNPIMEDALVRIVKN